MPTNTEYRIEKVSDLLAIPDDKIDAALLDLKAWLTFVKNSKAAFEKGMVEAGEPVVLSDEGFIWIDDGEPGITNVDVVSGNGELLVRVPVSGPRKGVMR